MIASKYHHPRVDSHVVKWDFFVVVGNISNRPSCCHYDVVPLKFPLSQCIIFFFTYELDAVETETRLSYVSCI